MFMWICFFLVRNQQLNMVPKKQPFFRAPFFRFAVCTSFRIGEIFTSDTDLFGIIGRCSKHVKIENVVNEKCINHYFSFLCTCKNLD